jgi:hypothetical protein
MTAEATAPLPRAKRVFARWHQWDRNFFLIFLALIWLMIVMGFGSDMIQHVQSHARPYLWIVHVHAVAYVGWLVLLTTQIALIRRGRPDIHMKLGITGMVLAPIMVALGVAAAIMVKRDFIAASHHGVPIPFPDHPIFLAIQFTNVLAFAVLAAAAFGLRGDSSAHKRLIILATLSLTNAGFSRWLGSSIEAMLGMGFWPFMAATYLGSDILMVGMGAYDLATRGRLHPVYLPAIIWLGAMQWLAVWLYFSPAWAPIAARLVGL